MSLIGCIGYWPALFLVGLLLVLLFLHRSRTVLFLVAVFMLHGATATAARGFVTAATALASTAAFATAAALEAATAAAARGMREQALEATTERAAMAATAVVTT